MELAGNTFLVTGGASGLGAGTVRTLVAGGANVVIADLQADKGEGLAKGDTSKAQLTRFCPARRKRAGTIKCSRAIRVCALGPLTRSCLRRAVPEGGRQSRTRSVRPAGSVTSRVTLPSSLCAPFAMLSVSAYRMSR